MSLSLPVAALLTLCHCWASAGRHEESVGRWARLGQCMMPLNLKTFNVRALLRRSMQDQNLLPLASACQVAECEHHISKPEAVGCRPPLTSISFACGGWLLFYLFGVGRAIQMRGLHKGTRLLGCSAGALIAVANCKMDATNKCYATPFGLFRLTEYATASITQFILPNWSRIESLPEGMLQIAVTRLPFFTKERIKKFASPQELKEALLASIAAYPFAQLVYRNAAWFIDGALTDFQPIVDEIPSNAHSTPKTGTLTVSPFFFSDADIKPSCYVPLRWCLFPPSLPTQIDWLYKLGYDDASRYFDGSSDDTFDRTTVSLRSPMHSLVKKLLHGSNGMVGGIGWLLIDVTVLLPALLVLTNNPLTLWRSLASRLLTDFYRLCHFSWRSFREPFRFNLQSQQ